jgi:DNA-binding response OmpR family regulator
VTAAGRPVRLLVLADDLIWSTRLVAQAREAGAEASSVRSAEAFARELPGVQAAIVDLTSRAYDGLAAIAAARDLQVPVLAVGQHDDHVLRRNALSVGADRVLAYRKLFDDGPATIARWLAATPASVAPARAEEAAPR